ncbi:MAG TPA: glycine--tRNA ligase subunit beta, partial [Actinopolymorphaceae bacterium]|nr:glycine--tRNA ligase subunit beta [Actinopolymorphaceae bacterium]
IRFMQKRSAAELAERRAAIVAAAQQLAAEVGGIIDVDGEAALLDEITNLVEQPVAIRGAFEERYLELPAEVLTTVMRKHQRYLPVRSADGALLPAFVAVADGACDNDIVRAGNESVLRARYEDAAFFWRADLEVHPDEHRAGLGKLAFENRLGSMAERADRIARGAAALADLVDLGPDDRATLTRAGQLVKFDLASQMVVELTSLAGTMGREYARRAGESEAVAQALYDMELPRTAGGPLPATLPGALLALADRFDLLAGLFAVGATPTGSSDPFALRRAALGVVNILRARPSELAAVTLDAGLAAASAEVESHGVEVAAGARAGAAEFVVRRYEQQLLDAGYDFRHVQAVLPLAGRPAVAETTLAELRRRTGNGDPAAADPAFADLVAALQRVRRIVPGEVAAGYDAGALTEPEELGLHQELAKIREALGFDASRPGAVDYGLAEFADAAAGLVGPINAFFDAVLVMAEDAGVRAARLGLLASIRDLAAPVLAWDEL